MNKVQVFQYEDEGGPVHIIGLRGHIIELDYPSSLNDWKGVNLADLIKAEPEKRITAHNIGMTSGATPSVSAIRLNAALVNTGPVMMPRATASPYLRNAATGCCSGDSGIPSPPSGKRMSGPVCCPGPTLWSLGDMPT